MKVLFDHQIFYQQRYGGVARYFYELIRALGPCGIEAQLAIRYSNNDYLRGDPMGQDILPFEDAEARLGRWPLPGKQLLFRLGQKLRIFPAVAEANIAGSLKQLRSGAWDVFHPTYYGTYYLRDLGKTPLVLTVYDMTHELFGLDQKTRRRKRKLLARADHVIAISESTRQDVIRLMGVPQDRVTTIHLANSLVPVGRSGDIPRAAGTGYILFVGNRGGYKNFTRFVHAIAPLLKSDRELRLTCAGPRFSASELELFGQLGISGQVDQQSANDQQLAGLYRDALVFVFPSLYEGFGIPVLESFACGCPLAASKTSSLPEVAGDAALYFDPGNEEEIRDCVQRLVSNGQLREELRQRGARRLEHFSWEATARATCEVYRLFGKPASARPFPLSGNQSSGVAVP